MPAGKKRKEVSRMSSVKPITGRQSGELCRLLEERGISSGDFQRLIEHPDNVVALMLGRGEEVPVNLNKVFESQIARLIEVEAYKQVGLEVAEYREEAEAAIVASSWCSELAIIGLDKVALVDYRLSGEFLAKASGVTCHIDPDKCTNYQGVVTPTDQILVIQGQWGSKYRNKVPCWCRENFHQLEQGLTVVEGLTVFLYEGISLLKDCFMDLLGSVLKSGYVPNLYLCSGEPGLCDRWDYYDHPPSGSASRGRILAA